MKERVCREGDRKVYQPRIHSQRIQDLFRIGQETGLPITVLVDRAVRGYIEDYQKKKEELKNEAEWNLENHEEYDDGAEDLSTYLDLYHNG